MGKAAMNQANYVIRAEIETSGMVEKSDVVGAVFGQTEGLLGDQMNLKELRKRGKVSRMEVEIEGKEGELRLPTSLNATDTALLAASLETIEKIGPTNADIKVIEIQDQRESKRDYIVKRAKQLLQQIERDSPDRQSIEEDLKKEIRKEQVREYKGFPAGPDAPLSEELILVEGESDVKNLVRHGVKNVLALGGSSVPEEIQEITEGREITAFVDGDRGGELILKELKEEDIPRYYTQAPETREVEELDEKTVHEKLRDREPVKYSHTSVEKQHPDFSEHFKDLVGTRAAALLDEEGEEVEKVPKDRPGKLSEEGWALVVDGEVDEKIIEEAEDLGLEYVAGKGREPAANSSQVRVITKDESEA